MRTQEEILSRIEEVDDFMDTQKSDLIGFLTFDNAKQFLNEEYLAKVESGEEEWKQCTDAKDAIIDYLPFAFGKAYNERGLSAGRSLMHMRAWIWLDDDYFYNEIVDSIDNYSSYGLPELIRIAKHYNVEIPVES